MQLSSLGLVLNPCASISVQGGSEPPLFLVQAPVKGAQYSVRVVNPEELPEAHRFLTSALIRGEPVEQVSEEGVAELQQIGLLAPVGQLPQPVHYNFDADRHVIDQFACGPAAAVAASGEPVRSRGFRMPAEWAELPLGFRAHHHGSVWAPLLATEPLGVPAACNAGAPELDARFTREFFAREGFAELPDLLPTSHVAELGRYFWALAGEGFMALDEARGSRRYVAHSHPVADFWHDQLNRRVSELVGHATKPSYSFVSLYLEGGELKWHNDRSPCEYTITLLLDYAPLDDAGRSPWALQVKGRDGTVHRLYQRIGDALIFKGRELLHSRDALPVGHRSGSLLFHFVDAEYDGEMI